MSIQEPITGQEKLSNPREPRAALAEFYRAFNTRDLRLMERNWDASTSLAGTGSQGHWTWIRAQHFDLPPLQRTFEATLFAL